MRDFLGIEKGLSSAVGCAAGQGQTAEAKQALVADPATSAWVSANAGTGKTHVLVQRVLRLLLAGAGADAILCLTFTKAAAAQMAGRLMRELGGWAAMSEDALDAALARLLGRTASAEECALARCLFTRVLDAPGGLKIMTIHAFCERVLRRFPLEAGVPPTFTLLTEEEQTATLREAVDAVLHEAAGAPQSDLGKALNVMVAHAGEDRFETLLERIAGKREDWRALVEYCGEHDPFARIAHFLARCFNLRDGETAQAILDEQAGLCSDALIASAVPVLFEAGGNNEKTAKALARARGLSGVRRVKMLAGAFLTKEGTVRADTSFVTKAVRKVQPGIADALCHARDRFAELECKRHAAETAAATLALLRLSDAMIQRYDSALNQRAALDFDGLIAKTSALLHRSGAADWVLYRLDADIAHLLVDEAQDTSPAQWALIKALTGEFFSGDSASEKPRTLFAVGDEKQSIYSFQGAAPKEFAANGGAYASRARASGSPWRDESFVLSRRSASAVLESVDLVFAGEAARGVTASGQEIQHQAHRIGEAGLVELWPPIKAEKRDAAPAWEPFAEGTGAAAPATMLAERIASQIRRWLDNGEMLVSQGRPVRAGDILILVRRRKPFADPMVKALKEHGIPVAGADRMCLTEQLAVMDLMVLGDFLLLPEDDLALATLLKTPFFGFDDDDLFAFGHEREGSLWDALLAHAAEEPAFAEAARRLELWRAEARRLAPFEFYSARLHEDGLRATLLARLGPDAADPIDEFVNLALKYETGETPTLQGFLHWLRRSDAEIKRDMDQERDEVRVMTIHGAKGLEAGIVFLADTCAFKSGDTAILPLDIPSAAPGAPKLPVWVLKGAKNVPAIKAARETCQQAEQEEYRRLLYVAMTRARDRLYVCGFENGHGRGRNCWYNLIEAGLRGRLAEARDDFGEPVWRIECPQTVAVRQQHAAAATVHSGETPGWLHRVAKTETAIPVIAPSRLVAGRTPIVQPGESWGGAEPLLRGRFVHRLLELLPALSRRDWAGAGHRLLAMEGGALPEDEREALLGDVTAILEAPDFAGIFGPDSRAEVAVAAEMRGQDRALVMVSGQIDRLLIREHEVLILDYKTGAKIPSRPEWIAPAYLAQLAAYRAALRRMFPDKLARAALLWTEAPLLMDVPMAVLDAAEQLAFPEKGGDPARRIA
jgi:ATP-dependent helicase/nuclease subunit A